MLYKLVGDVEGTCDMLKNYKRRVFVNIHKNRR